MFFKLQTKIIFFSLWNIFLWSYKLVTRKCSALTLLRTMVYFAKKDSSIPLNNLALEHKVIVNKCKTYRTYLFLISDNGTIFQLLSRELPAFNELGGSCCCCFCLKRIQRSFFNVTLSAWLPANKISLSLSLFSGVQLLFGLPLWSGCFLKPSTNTQASLK